MRPGDKATMSNDAPQSSQTKNWKDIYVAVLLEGDEDRVLSLIVEAERAIVERARELFRASGDNIQEEETLCEALYALELKRNVAQALQLKRSRHVT
jgi:hypothetical protein